MQTVRALLDYVKSVDPRIARIEEQRKQAKLEREEATRKKKEETIAKNRAKLEAYRAEIRRQHDEMEAEGEIEEDIVEIFYCDICSKKFKKEGQLKNHFNSKKHK